MEHQMQKNATNQRAMTKAADELETDLNLHQINKRVEVINAD